MASVMLAGLSKSDNKRLAAIFKSVNVTCDVVPTLDQGLEKIPGNPPALVIVPKTDDIRPLQGLHETLRIHAPVTPFLAVIKARHGGEALQAMRAGAFDCLTDTGDRYRVLSASKRATSRLGRTLFVRKVVQPKSPVTLVSTSILAVFLVGVLAVRIYHGPPPRTIHLGSAHIAGLQWQGRSLWVGDWFDSIITEHVVKKHFIRNARVLSSKNIYKVQDVQPILLANAADSLYTIGADLKMRNHQRSVGLPALQTQTLPGTNPTGLAWDGRHVWSSDGITNTLYQHGDDMRVSAQIRSVLNPTLGLSHDGESFWVVGGSPLKLMRLTVTSKGHLWDGPFALDDVLSEGISPSGVAVGFNRVWLVSGGDPRMMSRPLTVSLKNPWGALR